jgi:hypothetical protein
MTRIIAKEIEIIRIIQNNKHILTQLGNVLNSIKAFHGTYSDEALLVSEWA